MPPPPLRRPTLPPPCRRRSRRLAGLLSVLLCVASAAGAHDSWLAPEPPAQAGAASLRLLLSTGDGFPLPGDGSDVTRVARADLLHDRGRTPLRIGLPRHEALPLQARWGKVDAALGVLSLHPREIELDAAAIASELAELGHAPAISARQATLSRWRERYRKHAKVVVRRADGAPLRVATQPQGLPFELVPDSDPSLLPEQGTLRVCAYLNGQPHGPVHLGLVDAAGRASWRWSDAAGCSTLQPGQHGYLLRAIHLRPATLPGLEWEADFAALTVYRLDAQQP